VVISWMLPAVRVKGIETRSRSPDIRPDPSLSRLRQVPVQAPSPACHRFPPPWKTVHNPSAFDTVGGSEKWVPLWQAERGQRCDYAMAHCCRCNGATFGIPVIHSHLSQYQPLKLLTAAGFIGCSRIIQIAAFRSESDSRHVRGE
jgi:hypothetical protein